MKDEFVNIKWEFEKDCRDKKNIGHSAAKRVGQRKGCKLPSDYMTTKEKNELNGEVISMNMNKPMTYSEFKELSKDLQLEYLQNLIDNHGGAIAKIASMFEVDRSTFQKHIKRVIGTTPTVPMGKPTREAAGKWAKFMAGMGVSNIQNASESPQKPVETTETAEEGNEPVKVVGPSQEELEAQAPAVEEWMDKPMTYQRFKHYDKYTQEAYLNRLIHRYDGSLKRIAAMFNVTKKALTGYLEKRDIKVEAKEFENNRKPEDKWMCFCEGIPYEKKEVKIASPENPDETTIVIPMEEITTSPNVVAVDIVTESMSHKPQISMAKISFKMKDLSSLTEIIDFLKNVGLPMNGTVTFELNA